MKKSILMSLLAVFALGTVSFAATTSNRNPIPEPSGNGIKYSTLRVGASEDDPIRVFKLVRFSTSGANQAAVVSGDALVYDTNSADGVSVRYTTTSADGSFAGFAVTTIQSADPGSTVAADDIGHRNWGWVVVHGPALCNITAGGSNGAAAGNPIITSKDSGQSTTPEAIIGNAAANISNAANTAGATNGFVMVAPASATATQMKVFVKSAQ